MSAECQLIGLKHTFHRPGAFRMIRCLGYHNVAV
jgi:hypothetical protein